MIRMALCLVVTLVLGFMMGWIISKISTKKRYLKKFNEVEKKLLKSEDAIKKLKEIHLNQKEDIGKIKEDNLMFKNELEKKSQELKKTEKKLSLSKQSLLQKNIELEQHLEDNENEIKGLEKVLLKAERMIAEKDNRILLFEKEQEENKGDNDYEELLITKDQFSYIEAQLLEYQKKILQLKELNKSLEEKMGV